MCDLRDTHCLLLVGYRQPGKEDPNSGITTGRFQARRFAGPNYVCQDVEPGGEHQEVLRVSILARLSGSKPL